MVSLFSHIPFSVVSTSLHWDCQAKGYSDIATASIYLGYVPLYVGHHINHQSQIKSSVPVWLLEV